MAASQLPTPQLPLVVKSPYMQTWVASRGITPPSGNWPSFWNSHIIGWTGWIRVDNVSYEWMGLDISKRPEITNITLTPTRTILSLEAGPVGFNVTYLSPINPSDLVQLSLPFGYFYIDAWSLDGKPHSVQFYSDITGEPLSSDTSDTVKWNTTQSGNVICHRMQVSNPLPMQDSGDQTTDGTLFFAMENNPSVTWQTGGAVGLREQIQNGTELSNSGDTKFRAMDDDWPVLAFHVDLGNITETNSSVFWTIGLVRDPVVQYTASGNIQTRRSYYWTAYKTGDNIITDVIAKFQDVKSKAIDLDNKILADGQTISSQSQYAYLISLSLRLVFGSIDITLPSDTLDTSDIKIFMKDIGTSGRVNPVETIYAALPAILYLNASLAGPLLEPLLEYQNSPNYKNAYATPDLGISYPKVQGNASNTMELALENCGNMLIMTLAHAMKSGDGSLLDRYYDLLKKWANYLEQHTLHPTGYVDADGQDTTGLSNLALKGILGLYAMGKISEVSGKSSSDTSHYQTQAQDYFSQWKSLAISSGRITPVYGDTSTWSLVYNLYAAKLLGSDLIDDEIYAEQTQFYGSKISTAPNFGFPYDTNDMSRAKSHWTMLTAAIVTDSSVRDSMMEMVWRRAVANDSASFPTTYDPNTGSPISGYASPAQGAMFAPLALSLSDKQILGFSDSKKGINAATIVGSVAGSVAGILILLGLLLFWCRRRRQKNDFNETDSAEYRGVLEPFLSQSARNDENIALLAPASAAATPLRSKGNLILSHAPPVVSSSAARGKSSGVRPASSGSSGNPAGDDHSDLRIEMERLRHEMAVLRSQQTQETDPPPLYDFGRVDERH